MVNKGGLHSIDLCVVALLISITLLVTTVSAASITVTTPNGGETWHQGTLQMIQWIYTGD